MRRSLFGGFLVAIGLAAFIAYNAVFTVNETQQALTLQFGEVQGNAIQEPGLKFKVPFIQNVIYFDKRILTLDAPVQEIIASDQKRLLVDAYARYNITDPLSFYQSARTVQQANARLSVILNGALRRVLAEASFTSIVRDDRPQLMARISSELNREAQRFGIEVVDVRILRADLPEANSQAVFQRMQTERQQEAAQIRAQGEEAARRITSRADRDATVIRAEAERESQQIRGDGDAARTGIFADAFGRDPEFFAFYRSMQAYVTGLQGTDTQLVLSPDSDFFRFFSDPMGATPQPPAVDDTDGVAFQPAQ
ncbi:MAG: protease modulator HflC [Pseudomonadota bacterium]